MLPRNTLSRLTGLAALQLALSLMACGGHALRRPALDSGAEPGDATVVAATDGLVSEKPGALGSDATGGAGGRDGAAGDATVVATGGAGGSTWPPQDGPVWRSSSSPLCLSGTPARLDLWSSERGVYALASALPDKLYFNDGTGWAVAPHQPAQNTALLTGVAQNGSLLYGSTDCGISLFDGNRDTCVCALAPSFPVFVVDSQHIYAISGARLLSYNGSYFTTYGKPLARQESGLPYQLWASSDAIVVAADAGKVYVYDLPNTDPRVLQIPEGGDATSVWGFAKDDLWVGSTEGRLAHYDGSRWMVATYAQGACSTIVQLWGAERTLFFASRTSVGRISSGRSETILAGPCSERDEFTPGVYDEMWIEKLWGNSPTEVFIVVEEQRFVVTSTDSGTVVNAVVPADGCGPIHVYWFNGEKVGRF